RKSIKCRRNPCRLPCGSSSSTCIIDSASRAPNRKPTVKERRPLSKLPHGGNEPLSERSLSYANLVPDGGLMPGDPRLLKEEEPADPSDPWYAGMDPRTSQLFAEAMRLRDLTTAEGAPADPLGPAPSDGPGPTAQAPGQLRQTLDELDDLVQKL